MAVRESDSLEKFADLQIGPEDVPRDCIRDFVRRLIVSRELKAGELLPSVRALTGLWNAHIPTVHGAFTDLLKEGLIVRRQGKGTYVAEQIEALRTVAVYIELSTLSDPNCHFLRGILSELRLILEDRGVEIQICVDSRRAKERKRIMKDLEMAAHRREVQGLIILAQGEEYLRWARNLPVPVSELTPLEQPFAVNLDGLQMVRLGVRRIAESGCKSIGVICPHNLRDVDPFQSPMKPLSEPFYEEFLASAAQHGLKIRNEWIRFPTMGLADNDFASFGHEAFHALWDLEEKPEGLFIDHDLVAEGVLPALMLRNVSVPNDLKLVIHRNAAHRLLCPFPVSYVVTSEKSCAEAMILQLDRQLRGEIPTPINVPSYLE